MTAKRPTHDAAVNAHLKRAILTVKPADDRVIQVLRWAGVARAFKISRGYAISLCRSVGVDPFVWVRRETSEH